MNAKKCDRCGRYYDINLTQLPNYKGRVTGVAMTMAGNGLRYVWDKDLCDECIGEFLDFMNTFESKQED